jgi:hypothetical protein
MNSQMDIIDDMNHVLKVLSSQDDMNENIASYTNPKISVSARMMAIITEFINRNNLFKKNSPVFTNLPPPFVKLIR